MTRMRYAMQVAYQFDLHTTNDCFAPANTCLLDALRSDQEPGPVRCLVYVDAGIAEADSGLLARVRRWFSAHANAGVMLAAMPELVPGGEGAKQQWSLIERIGQQALDCGLCRHSYIITIGGGAVLDAVGCAASLIHRGLRQIRLPTTTLAQDDAGLGVKNGLNAFGNKNFFGTFTPPVAIINDRRFLRFQDDRTWRAGIAEAFKVAIIKDRRFVDYLIAHAASLGQRDEGRLVAVVQRCAELHLKHITTSGDPFEQGSSRPLDFGHWAAHRLEILSQHELNHGEAVAIGLAIDLGYALRIGRIQTVEYVLLLDALETVGFTLWHDALELRDASGARSVLHGLEQFREHLGGRLTIAMPDGLGAQRDVTDMDADFIEASIGDLAQRQQMTVRDQRKSSKLG